MSLLCISVFTISDIITLNIIKKTSVSEGTNAQFIMLCSSLAVRHLGGVFDVLNYTYAFITAD